MPARYARTLNATTMALVPLGAIQPTLSGYMTWRGTWRSGPKTAGTTTMMARQPMERLERMGGLAGVELIQFVAEGEMPQPGFTGLPFAKDTYPITATGFLVFPSPGHYDESNRLVEPSGSPRGEASFAHEPSAGAIDDPGGLTSAVST